jgi:hypothetical protein
MAGDGMAKASGPAEREGFLARLTREDTIAGLMFMAVAAFGLWIGQDYPVGTALRMGPGYVPRGLCLILLGLGTLIVLFSMLSQRRGEDAGSPPDFSWRPLLLIPLSVIAFALTLTKLGLVAATALLILIAAIADKGQRPIEIMATLVVLVLMTVGVFVWGVGIPLRLWPEF